MFRIPISASYRTPGFDWKEMPDGTIKGRIYTTWPLRFRTRFKPIKFIAAAIAILAFIGTEADFGQRLSIAIQSGVAIIVYGYPLALIWPFWPFVKTLKMNADYFSIGWRRFNLAEMSSVRTQKADDHRNHDSQLLYFHYGWRDFTIGVENPPGHTLLIAETLNEARQRMLEHGAAYTEETPPEPARVSAF